MNKIRFIYTTLSIIVFFGCSTHHHNTDKIKIFTRKDFVKDTTLKGTLVGFHTSAYPLNYTVIRDSLIFVTNWHGDPWYVEIYNLHSKQLIRQIARKGDGPNEFLSCRLIYSNPSDDYFLLYDLVKQSASKYSIDSVCLSKSVVPMETIALPRCTKDIALYDTTTLIGYNSYFFQSGKYQNKVPALFAVNSAAQTRDDINKIDSINAKFFTANVSGGYILVSPSSDQIWSVRHYEDRIDIFDKKLQLVRSIVGPDRIRPLYEVKEDNSISFRDHKYYRAYYPCAYTKNAVYMIYLGHNGISGDGKIEKPVEIFKIDWSGKLLCRYKLDKYVYAFSIDKNEENIYATATDKFGNYPLLLKYKL
jgi:hypothetical protein